ncbi:MAG TPA: response regulator [Sideroxyarcus sp.]|nr:response regulator [Sideroxyarcus sp.]
MNGYDGKPVVCVVDDDEAMRDSIACLLESEGLASMQFADAGAFREFCRPQLQGCIVLDIRMPGMSGMDLLEQLKADGVALPVIIITGHGDIPLAVRALKLGAFDFVQKPFKGDDLLDRVRAALLQVEQDNRKSRSRDELRSHFDALTKREREIMELVVTGDSSKMIGIRLGISARTVEIHRSNIMRKLNIRSVAELVQNRLALRDD